MKNSFGKILFITIFLSIFGFGSIVWPIFVFGLVFSMLTDGKEKKSASQKSNYNRAKKTEDNQKAVSALKQYFLNRTVLQLEGGLVLKKETNQLASVDGLVLYLDDDQIATLDEFKKTYASTYNDLLQQCQVLIESNQVQPVKETVEENKKETQTGIEHYIELLNAQNLDIENKEVSNGLYEVCAYLKQINLIVKQFPQSKEKTAKLTRYYLPILLEILDSYKQLDKSARNHEEFQKTHQRLLKTILLINEALKTITTSLTQEYFMDLSADMTTLETLLKKDGLVKEGSISNLRKQVIVRE